VVLYSSTPESDKKKYVEDETFYAFELDLATSQGGSARGKRANRQPILPDPATAALLFDGPANSAPRTSLAPPRAFPPKRWQIAVGPLPESGEKTTTFPMFSRSSVAINKGAPATIQGQNCSAKTHLPHGRSNFDEPWRFN